MCPHVHLYLCMCVHVHLCIYVCVYYVGHCVCTCACILLSWRIKRKCVYIIYVVHTSLICAQQVTEVN